MKKFFSCQFDFSDLLYKMMYRNLSKATLIFMPTRNVWMREMRTRMPGKQYKNNIRQTGMAAQMRAVHGMSAVVSGRSDTIWQKNGQP